MAADRVLSGPGAEGGASQSQGRLIGRRYRLMSPVGRGGMGMVWHAHDVLLARDVAVKELILPFGLDHAGKQVAHRRMLREARSAARLTHPGIITVHDVVEEDGRPWIVMELVRAWSLEQAVRQGGPLPVVQAAEIGIRVLDALRHAHSAGILHRDIKPGNVLLTADRVVLTDFGIAAIEGDVTITQTGLLMGSPAYIPPERLSGQPLTQAADLWSFGATLYAAVEGRPPYEGPDAIAVLGTVLTQEPNPPQRAGALRPVIDGLLRKNPAERLTSDQVVEQLERVLRAHGSARPRVPDVPPPPPLPPDPDFGAGEPLPGPPSGPLPSRIVETPSGPVRVPYDPLGSSSGGYAVAGPAGGHPTDQLRQPPVADGFDAFGSRSGPHRVPENSSGSYPLPDPSSGSYPLPAPSSGSYPLPDPASGSHRIPDMSGLHDTSGPQRMPEETPGPQEAPFVARGLLDGPSNPPLGGYPNVDDDEPSAPPILPLTSDSRTAGRSAPWPLASPDDLRDQSRDLSREMPHSRLATLPGVAHRQTRSRRRPDDSGNAWVRGGRPTPLLLLTAVAAVVAVVAALVLLSTGGTTEPAVSASPTASAADAAPSPVPDGYREHTPPGFTVALPDSWKLTSSGDEATFTGPKDSGLTIEVEQATPQADGGLSELTRREADGGVDAYIQVQLQAVKYRGWKAADWEYTYTTGNGVPMHALTRHVTIDERTAYTIAFTMPELRWDDEADTRKVFLDTFRETT
ncbi:serine/threonine-protein kinase [Nonomuraea ceibae]|uniref:serine/threonine-protein kinase n=1 Tax=Nonomuraea ceibae TaxID=1935170 RepID=UPI001FE61052|nr:serine/threonine-protein kinase [Nonomuraea ceibae]